jgi:ComF family protein
MTGTLSRYADALLHLLFPHLCSGCGNDLLPKESCLCLHCREHLPQTLFEQHQRNPIEKIFTGRLPLAAASAAFYFSKASLLQHLMHRFKYKQEKELGLQLGEIMGRQLEQSGRFAPDALVPLPLFADREKKRGYNQAAVLCEGIAASLRVPVLTGAVIRPRATETQTRKNRVERWQNIEGQFQVSRPELIRGRHILLVDDVITTGATLEACGQALLEAGPASLSVASLCYAAH